MEKGDGSILRYTNEFTFGLKRIPQGFRGTGEPITLSRDQSVSQEVKTRIIEQYDYFEPIYDKTRIGTPQVGNSFYKDIEAIPEE